MQVIRFALSFIIAAAVLPVADAAIYVRGQQLPICHRTANRDAPENTLEAIREARIPGCDVVEMDISRTLDGVLVLLHDGPIDRVSSGCGEIEKMLSTEMSLYDAGRTLLKHGPSSSSPVRAMLDALAEVERLRRGAY
jgi:glycerophosphoryl diester phosphodiesterase